MNKADRAALQTLAGDDEYPCPAEGCKRTVRVRLEREVGEFGSVLSAYPYVYEGLCPSFSDPYADDEARACPLNDDSREYEVLCLMFSARRRIQKKLEDLLASRRSP